MLKEELNQLQTSAIDDGLRISENDPVVTESPPASAPPSPAAAQDSPSKSNFDAVVDQLESGLFGGGGVGGDGGSRVTKR